MPQIGPTQIQQQTQQQVQTLSPQQILVIKLIELPTLELENRVQQEVLDNPALEEGPDPEVQEMEAAEQEERQTLEEEYDALNDYRNEDDIPDYKLQDKNKSNGEKAAEIPFSDTTSFYETLTQQLDELNLTPKDYEIATHIIGTIDDDGLLRKTLQALSDELAIYNGIDVSTEKLESLLKEIQGFDPAGIAARSLQECLLIQIARKRMAVKDDEARRILDMEKTILSKYYDDFTHKHWDKIRQKMNADQDSFQVAIREITRLNPRPGASMGESIGKNFQQIVPDFIVEVDDDGEISLSLNDFDIPELRINKEYARIIQEKTGSGQKVTKQDKDALMFIKQKLDSAQSFIDAIKQRHNTLTSCMSAIIDMQRTFFLEGDEALLKPMILKDVAERTHLDISTVSRVSNSKYVQTAYGIFPLKFFFSDGYTTQDGEELSVRQIRQILKETVNGEDKNNPYTDDELAEILANKGYPIARRTVAKYRQQMNIPVARLRR